MEKETRHAVVIADWKDANGLIKQLAKQLSAFGVYLHDVGGNSDNFELLLANEKLTDEEAKAIGKKMIWGE